MAPTRLRFSGVGAAPDELELERDLLVLWAPFALLALEEEEAVAGGLGVCVWREDGVEDEWEGRVCDDDADDDGFFFFLRDAGASYVRKDSNDMVGASKYSSSSRDGESLGARGRPGKTDVNRKGRRWSRPIFRVQNF